jgi:hypothetical protein
MAGRHDTEEAASFRVGYAARFENDGDGPGWQSAVADRAARTMRDGSRDMRGATREPEPLCWTA